MIEIFRQYLEIKSLNELNDVNKPDEKCKIEILEKPDFQLNKFFYKQIGKNHRWIDRLSWTDQNWKNYLDNKNVKTFKCRVKDELKYVLDNLNKLVVKEVHGSGGYGMLVGPLASKTEISKFKKKIIKNPYNYIAQPTLSLSTCPIYTKKGLTSRHVDLRCFALLAKEKVSVTSGGLTRVALKKDSLVVNSSQGGGTKDTWILSS